jgi:RNA polymerase sigma-70 factor (ECF subfamily)
MADAEDIAQDVFLAYLTANVTFLSEEHEKAWLIRVTVNKSKNYIKTHWFRGRTSLSEDLSYLPEEENEALSAVLELDVKYRLPIHLFYYESYSLKEIADILQTNPATIGTRLARARGILKKKLGGINYE